jgi:hypothetical protein
VWEALEAVYAWFGFDQIADEVFKALVLARIIEPTSKADTVRVLTESACPLAAAACSRGWATGGSCATRTTLSS